MPEIKLKKRIIYSGEVFASLMSRGWGCTEASNFLRAIREADAAEVVHGRWEQARYTEAPLYICSKCDKPEYKQHNYCPNCGAKMDGGDGT